MGECQTDVVETLHQPPAGVVVEVERCLDVTGPDLPLDEIDGDICGGLRLDQGVPPGDDVGRQDDPQGATPERGSAEDVTEPPGDEHAEALILPRPDRL